MLELVAAAADFARNARREEQENDRAGDERKASASTELLAFISCVCTKKIYDFVRIIRRDFCVDAF